MAEGTAGSVALAHAPEGAGNATRMLAIAVELVDRGREVAVAGGGPGTSFLRSNGFEPFEPTTVDFTGRRQSSLPGALAATAPRARRRLRDFLGWLRERRPAVVLTDDPFAALAATRLRIPFFRLDHATAADFDATFERLGYGLFNRYSLWAGEAFLYTCLRPDRAPPGVVPVGPVAYEPADPEPVDPFDVLVVPGTFSTEFGTLADRLRDAGRSVRLVGGPNWEPVPAMYPYAAAADAVVCTGFSSIAEATVAGTFCVVHPVLDCQRGIADRIARHGVAGVAVADSLDAAFDAAREPGPAPAVANGTGAVADAIETRLDP